MAYHLPMGKRGNEKRRTRQNRRHSLNPTGNENETNRHSSGSSQDSEASFKPRCRPHPGYPHPSRCHPDRGGSSHEHQQSPAQRRDSSEKRRECRDRPAVPILLRSPRRFTHPTARSIRFSKSLSHQKREPAERSQSHRLK